jgi:hypothetical protein
MFPTWKRRTWLMVLAAAVLALFVANGHLVYVAFQSQPECVTAGGLQAAKAAC